MADTEPKKDMLEFNCVLIIGHEGEMRLLQIDADNVNLVDCGLLAGEVPVSITLRIPPSRFDINVDGYNIELDETEADEVPKSKKGRALEL